MQSTGKTFRYTLYMHAIFSPETGCYSIIYTYIYIYNQMTYTPLRIRVYGSWRLEFARQCAPLIWPRVAATHTELVEGRARGKGVQGSLAGRSKTSGDSTWYVFKYWKILLSTFDDYSDWSNVVVFPHPRMYAVVQITTTVDGSTDGSRDPNTRWSASPFGLKIRIIRIFLYKYKSKLNERIRSAVPEKPLTGKN